MNIKKYPSTPYLPFSASLPTKANIISLADLEALKTKEIVITEKMDGETSSLYHTHWHPRSLTYSRRVDRNFITALHAGISYRIPDSIIIIGENVSAVHNIYYNKLPDKFLVFGIVENDVYLSWKDVIDWANLLNLKTVPILYQGSWDEVKIKSCYTGISKYGDTQEGYIVRMADSFHSNAFSKSIAKFVREGHVQPDDSHWTKRNIKFNEVI